MLRSDHLFNSPVCFLFGFLLLGISFRITHSSHIHYTSSNPETRGKTKRISSDFFLLAADGHKFDRCPSYPLCKSYPLVISFVRL